MLHALLKKLVLLFLLFSPIAWADISLQLIDGETLVRLNSHLKVYDEEDGRLSLNQIMQKRHLFNWRRGENPNYGFKEKGLWLYGNFSNVTDYNDWIIDVGFSQLDKVDIYIVVNDRVIASASEGKARLNQTYRFPTVTATIPFAVPVELFIRIESEFSSIVAPVDIQSKQYHAKHALYDSLFWGVFYGGLLILAIYNLVLFIGLKEKSLIAYVGYIVAVVFWQLVWGGHLQLLAPNALTLWLGQHTDLIFIVIGIASGVFTYFFLNIEKSAPRTSPFVRFNIATLGVLGVCSMFNLLYPMWQNGIVYIMSLLAILSYLLAGFEAYFNDFKAARYFIFAWSILAAAAIVGMLSLTGVFPSNFFTTYCFQIGAFVESGLFSIALMEKSRDQLESEVNQATSDLRNNMELIEEQNVRLDIARKDAIKASKVKSQFLANMSHEIRTPLNAILGFSKELNQLTLPPEKQEQVFIINSAADNLLTIVNDILDFSKIEAGKLPISNQPFSPSLLLEEMVSVMAKSAHLKKLEFVYEISPLPEKLIGDIFRIKQVLNNLLSNALKFTPNGHVCLSASGRELEHNIFELNLSIEDTGIGISQSDRKKLFNAFSQVDEATNRTYQGTGLGLVICKELTRLMRGQLELTSVPSLGSIFCVKLRLNLLNNKYQLVHDSEWKDKNVVIFDPYSKTRRASAKLLSCLGAKVTSVESIAFLNTLDEPFDYLFACLPQYKQHQHLEMLKALSVFKANNRFLMYSGEEPLSQHESFKAAFGNQVRMPITPAKLSAMLHEPINDSRTEMQQTLQTLPSAKVLAVDDMELNLRLLKTWLKASPLDLTLAFNGREAVNLCEKHEYDLILMDVQMPQMDGVEATKRIRKTELNLGTPIVAVTAHAFKEEQERLLESGMDDYLPKPLELIDLITVIKRWCHSVEPHATTLPSLDWQAAVKQANEDKEVAAEMLRDFMQELPTMLEDVERLWQERSMEELKSVIHKIHGACCYTGVPKLQSLSYELESAIKLGQYDLVSQRLPFLILEGELVIQQSPKLLQSALPTHD